MAYLIKMHNAPHQERLDFHRYCLAADSLEHANEALKRIKSFSGDKEEETKMTSYLLRVAFYTLYGRPFKQRPALRIGEDVVPETWLPLHRSLLGLRDKMFAHSDQDFLTSTGDPLNRILVHVKPKSVAFGTHTLEPLDDSLQNYTDLIILIRDTLLYRRNKIFMRWHRHLGLPPGSKWEINAEASSNEVMKRITTDTPQYTHFLTPLGTGTITPSSDLPPAS